MGDRYLNPNATLEWIEVIIALDSIREVPEIRTVYWGSHFVHVLFDAQAFVLVGYSMSGAKALAHKAT